MNPIEKLGLAMMLYGLAIRMWMTPIPILISMLFMFIGGVLFFTGQILYPVIRRKEHDGSQG